MSFAIENYVNQIAKTLFSQKKLLLSFVQIHNNTQINKFFQQYQTELDKLNAIHEEFYSKQNEKMIESDTNNAGNGTNEGRFNQIKSQVELVKSELTNLKSKKESLENLKERVDVLEQTYTIFKKNQDFCSDFQFNEFLTVYNSTMECTRESIRMNHEDIMKLKAITHHLQKNQDIDSIINSIKCLKHEVKSLKRHSLQAVSNLDLSSNQVDKTANNKYTQSNEPQHVKVSGNDYNKKTTDLNQSPRTQSTESPLLNDKINQQPREINVNNLTQEQINNLEQQYKEFKQMKTSIGCIKHEMRNLKVLYEDNVRIASQVDILFDKYKKLKEKMKLENSSPNSPKRSGANSDEDSTQQIRKDLQILKQNFVETFSMQNSSIANQSDRIKALQKSFDEINSSRNDKIINDRLKIIETKLQIITSLAGSS